MKDKRPARSLEYSLASSVQRSQESISLLSGLRWPREAGATASGSLWDIGHSYIRRFGIVLSG